MQYQTCFKILETIRLHMVPIEDDIATCLIERLQNINKRYILVTGIDADRVFHISNTQLMEEFVDGSELISEDNSQDERRRLEIFSNTIDTNSNRQVICFCPTNHSLFVEFINRLPTDCSLFVFVLGFTTNSPRRFIDEYRKSLFDWNKVENSSTGISSIVSLDDGGFTIDAKRKLRSMLEVGDPIEDELIKSVEAFEYFANDMTPKGEHQSEDEAQGVLHVDEDVDCLKYVDEQRCECGQFWSMTNYHRSDGIDIIECLCSECKTGREFAFRPNRVHTSLTDLLRDNRQYVRM